jgi:hypothetical protein
MARRSNIANLALMNFWIKEIQSKKYTKSQLISLAANLCIELSRYKNAIPTLHEQIQRDNTIKKLVPSAGGRGKARINKEKKEFVHKEWLKWNANRQTIGRYKTKFVQHILVLFEKPEIIKKYGKPFTDKYINRLCLEWEKK